MEKIDFLFKIYKSKCFKKKNNLNNEIVNRKNDTKCSNSLSCKPNWYSQCFTCFRFSCLSVFTFYCDVSGRHYIKCTVFCSVNHSLYIILIVIIVRIKKCNIFSCRVFNTSISSTTRAKINIMFYIYYSIIFIFFYNLLFNFTSNIT